MQFYKLHYFFFKLMNAQHTCNLLRIITVLMTVITMSIATNDFYAFEENLENVVKLTTAPTPASASDTIKTPKINETNTTHNALFTDAGDFEQILSAQLKREEEQQHRQQQQQWQRQQKGEELSSKLQTPTGYNTNADYDTTEAISARKSLLSRKRRYLLFPEGTSFQVVYDGIIGIVDYTNYLILGITLALAWELPTKAPSEQLEDIKQQVQDGTLFLPRNDTATNITYVDIKNKKKQIPIQSQNQNRNHNQYIKPNYINMFSYRKSNYTMNPYYKNKSPILQPVFMPPMHRNYYYQHHNQLPNTYKTIKPGTDTRRHYKNPYDYYYSHNYGKEHNSDWRRKDNYYYTPMSHKKTNPFKKWMTSKAAYTTPYDQTKYPWWNLATRLTNSFRKDVAMPSTNQARQFNNVNNAHSNQQQEKQTSESGYYQSNAPTSTTSLLRNATMFTSPSSSSSSSSSSSMPKSAASIPRKHHIYPVFGKRSLPDIHIHTAATTVSIEQPHNSQQQQQQQQHHHQRKRRRCGIDNDELSKFDRIHIRHHRHTRHTLYEKIEKYLDKRGSHGHHCVLRALCETSKKSNEPEPGSFLGELMRTVFTLPEPIDEDLQKLQYKESRYDAAHAYEGDCAARYFHCKDSLWKSHFVA